MANCKNFNAAKEKVASGGSAYSLEAGVKTVKEVAFAKFDETVEIAVRLGVDPRHADQMLRGTVVLPNGTGTTLRVLVLAKGEKEKEAQDAGADFVGSDDYIEKIANGWMDFDRIIATPDIMGAVSKLGRVLGPRGLMPNPKTGSVTFDIAKAVNEVKKGQITFKVDKAGNLHAIVGKVSFSEQALKENIMAFLENVVKLKPASSKGQYLKGITLSSTMGPGVKLDLVELRNVLRV